MKLKSLKWQKLKTLSLPEQNDFQDNLLNHFLKNEVYPFSDYYREIFKKNRIDVSKIRHVGDLERIPFTEKKDLIPDESYPDKILDFVLRPTTEKIFRYSPIPRKLCIASRKILAKDSLMRDMRNIYQPVLLTATTGRSSAPVSFLYTSYDIKRLETAGIRMIDVFDVDPTKEKGVNIFPFAPHLAFWQVTFAGFGSKMLILGTGGGKVIGTKGNLRIIEKIKPSFIVGVPGYIYHLLRTGAEYGTDFSSIKKVVLGAEKVPPGLKEKMVSYLQKQGAQDVDVLGTYGFTEARMAFAECPTNDPSLSYGYHTFPDMGIFEVIDPITLKVLPPNTTGELVYTPLDARGTVVLRYRTGDIAEGGIQVGRCPGCGALVPRISSKLSRVSNVHDLNLSKVKGTLVNLNSFQDLLYNHPDIEEWQVEIRKKNDDPFDNDVLLVNIAIKEGIDKESFKTHISDDIQESLEVCPNEVNILPLDDLLKRLGMENELKEKRIIDAR